MTRAEQVDDPIRVLGWAAFLGSSWTWCIGMFLPALFVRDYGLAGWFVFATPNVVGAAAMGWVLRRRGQGAWIVREHRIACLAFSFVTVLFQCFFVGWVGFAALSKVWPLALPIVAYCAFAFAGRRFGRSADCVGAAVALGISAIMLLWGLGAGYLPKLPPAGLGSRLPYVDLLYLAPVTAFGFAFCPYLDLTFHRARRATSDAGARFAFGVGFGVLFLAMIVFTLCYSGWAVLPLSSGAGIASLPTLVFALLVTHLSIQVGFTVSVHLREIARTPAPFGLNWAAVCSLGIVAAYAIGAWCDFPGGYHGLTRGEIAYRCFMAFYGLVFPAYIWICAIPTGDGRPTRTPAKLIALAIAVAGATPMYWLGFIEQRPAWLGPGFLIIVACRWIPALMAKHPLSREPVSAR